MSTGKQQQQFSNGRGNGDPTTIDIDPSSTSHADVPPPAYSSTLERVGKQDERSPLLGSGVPSSSSPSVMRNLTPAMEAARRAIDPSSQQRSCVTGLRQRWRELWQRFVWWWDDSWLGKFTPDVLLFFVPFERVYVCWKELCFNANPYYRYF